MASKFRSTTLICCAVCGAVVFLIVAGSQRLWLGETSPFGGRTRISFWQLLIDDWSRPPLLHFLWDAGGDGHNVFMLLGVLAIGALAGSLVCLMVRRLA
jgi:hypothetical protein